MYLLLILVFQAAFISDLHLYCSEGTSITLSPSGMVSVCPGGKVLLTCERTSGPFLYWNVSVPRLAMTREIIVSSQGVVSATSLQFSGLHLTAFTITRTSISPLTSQMMVNDVTTIINGSTIYCSEDGNENEASMATITVTNEDSFRNRLNIILVNHFLRNSITVTFQWPREAGTVYHVSVSPLTEMNTAVSHDSFVINLTVSYNIQYKLNVSIVSNLCNSSTTRLLKYVTCDLPTQLLQHDHLVMVNRSQDSPYREGQFITYTCPPGFILTGPNALECTGNGRWEPDSGQVDCIADCGEPVVDKNVTFYYSSTLEGSRSVLILTCENFTTERILSVTCHSSGNWIPDPAQFTCSFFTTPPSEISLPPSVAVQITGSGTASLIGVFSSIIVIVSAVCSIVFLSIGYACGWFSQKHKQSHTRKAEDGKSNEGSQLPPTSGPLYKESQQRSTPEHQDLVELKENVAYGPIIHGLAGD